MIVLKIVIIGDGGVGKTAIRERYLSNQFQSEYVLTIGADFAMRDEIVNSKSIRYQIWDLAGQQRFDGVREVYYKGALGALLIYDVTRPESYFNTPKWINELWTNNTKGRIPVVVVGNKIDLREECDETISSEQGKLFADRLTKLTASEGFTCHYVEASAKSGINIQEAFSLLGKNIMKFAERRQSIRQKSDRSIQPLAHQPIIG
ncbi:MAG: GTP-binding protein [Candidatus Heimdallarchaeota archaeon]|nr:MAG: GTP-binding protein [Candidatus Heimdallarchaeota archaeon]